MEDVARALVSGSLDEKSAILAVLYLMYETTGKHMYRDWVVRLLRKYGYDISPNEFYSYASKLREEGLIKTILVKSYPVGKRVAYTVNDDDLPKVERELKRKVSEALEGGPVIEDSVDVATPEEVKEKIGMILFGAFFSSS